MMRKARRLHGRAKEPSCVPEQARPCGIRSDLPHPVTRQVRRSARLNGAAGDIMLAARELYETEGVAATSMAAIARKAGVARSLVLLFPRQAGRHRRRARRLPRRPAGKRVHLERATRLRRHASRTEELRVGVPTHALHRVGQAAPYVRRAGRAGPARSVRHAGRPRGRGLHPGLHRVRIHRISHHRNPLGSRNVRASALRAGRHDEGETRHHRRRARRADRADASPGYDGARPAAVARASRRARPAGKLGAAEIAAHLLHQAADPRRPGHTPRAAPAFPTTSTPPPSMRPDAATDPATKCLEHARRSAPPCAARRAASGVEQALLVRQRLEQSRHLGRVLLELRRIESPRIRPHRRLVLASTYPYPSPFPKQPFPRPDRGCGKGRARLFDLHPASQPAPHPALHPAHEEPFARADEISCVIVPMGQNTHHERGLNSSMENRPITVDVSMTP